MSGYEIIKEHKCLLDKMKKDRIFSLCFENNKFYLDETLYLIFDYPYKYYTFKHFEV